MVFISSADDYVPLPPHPTSQPLPTTRFVSDVCGVDERFLVLAAGNLARRAGVTGTVVTVIVWSPMVTAWTLDTERSTLATVVVSVGVNVGSRAHPLLRHQARLCSRQCWR